MSIFVLVLVVAVAAVAIVYMLTPREHATTADTITAAARAVAAVA